MILPSSSSTARAFSEIQMMSPFLRYTWDSNPLTEPRARTMRMNSSRRWEST
jgi:hypothetical protein